MPVQDIQLFKSEGGDDCVIFNGPDEQFISGRLMGAEGAIGGTYGVMPQLFLKADACLKAGDWETARNIQYDIDQIIYSMCACKGNMYAVIKELLRRNGLDIGSVRSPLTPLVPEDMPQVDICERLIKEATNKYC